MGSGSRIPVYVEKGKRRAFAGALDWPGWCRSGRDEDSALEALAAYGRRYERALGRVASGLKPPGDASAFEVADRLRGDATTDFGAPSRPPKVDRLPLDDAEAKRQGAILKAAWRAFDAAAERAEGMELRRGPRGGGRDLEAIVRHVMEADRAYLGKLGGSHRTPGPDGDAGLRVAILDLLAARARGEPPPRTPRSGSLWSPRYFVRRSAWHALDHAWEIEDRATSNGSAGRGQ